MAFRNSDEAGRRRSAQRLASAPGLSAWFTEGALLRRLDAGGISMVLYPADDLEAGPANIFLRRRGSGGAEVAALLGPGSNSSAVFTNAGPVVAGRWGGLEYRVSFVVAGAATAWYWHVAVTNRGAEAAEVDVVHTQDVALAAYAAVRTNEYYVSQYLDLTPIETDEVGTALAVRQNMPGPTAAWMVLGSLRDGVGWSTDALQLRGNGSSRRSILNALRHDLPSTRLQHEHTLAAIQDRAVVLGRNETLRTGFFGISRPHHPEATSAADREAVTEALGQPEARGHFPPTTFGDRPTAVSSSQATVASLWSSAATLGCLPLDEEALSELAGAGRHHEERSGDALLSYFTDEGSHVVTAAKEAVVLRPHAHIMRTGSSLVPETASLTTTCWMAGTFHSQVTQGHVAHNRILSTRRSYLGLKEASGLRVFLRPAGGHGWALLCEPSAWAIDPDRCRWWYRHEGGLLEVVSTAPAEVHELGLSFRTLVGPPCDLLVCAHVALGGDDGLEPEPPEVQVTDTGVTVSPMVGSAARSRHPGGSFRLSWEPGLVAQVGGDENLFADGKSRSLPWVTLSTAAVSELKLTLTVDLVGREKIGAQDLFEAPWPRFWQGLTDSIRLESPVGGPHSDEVGGLNTVLRWFAHDALIHYLAPRGLEQHTGGAWGTRDVCQGPVGLLVAIGEMAPVRDVLLRVFRVQRPGGDWPQSFEFLFDESAHGEGQSHREGEGTSQGQGTSQGEGASQGEGRSHGDVIFWPLLALGEYLAISGDSALLGERVDFGGSDAATSAGGPASAAVIEHVRLALDRIAASTVPGTPLPAYGGGDWNDSLQPADPQMAAHLCSSWTATLQVHALRTLAHALRQAAGAADVAGAASAAAAAGGGVDAAARDLASACASDAEQLVEQTAAALQKVLIADGELAGYALFGAGGEVEHLVHPSDQRTGLHHGVLQMIHAISADLLTPEQAQAHLAVIKEHLLGPDGARLFDRPAAYRGGPMKLFRRAEAATFFGREIGMMYTHAHLRYAEALARYGDAEGLLRALALVNPIGMNERVPQARPRQSTCYYSSSDAAFSDRYEAQAHYDRINRGEVALEGGWRVYSSGPGIFLRLVVESMLGIRLRGRHVEIDPVLAHSLDGLKARIVLDGAPLDISYRVGERGFGPTSVTVNGVALPAVPLANPYREPGVSVPLQHFRDAITSPPGTLQVEVG